MENVLYQLFELLNDGAHCPETERAVQEAEPGAMRLEELTADSQEFDEIWTAAVQVGAAENPVWFARGIRMGARLMLEVLGEKGV